MVAHQQQQHQQRKSIKHSYTTDSNYFAICIRMHDIRGIFRHKKFRMQANSFPAITLIKIDFLFPNKKKTNCIHRLVMGYNYLYCGMDFRDEIIIGIQYNNEWNCMLENYLSMIIIFYWNDVWFIGCSMFIVTLHYTIAMECTWENVRAHRQWMNSKTKYKKQTAKNSAQHDALGKLENCILCAMHTQRHTHKHEYT